MGASSATNNGRRTYGAEWHLMATNDREWQLKGVKEFKEFREFREFRAIKGN